MSTLRSRLQALGWEIEGNLQLFVAQIFGDPAVEVEDSTVSGLMVQLEIDRWQASKHIRTAIIN